MLGVFQTLLAMASVTAMSTTTSTELCAAGDANCRPAVDLSRPLTVVYDDHVSDAKLYFRAFDYAMQRKGAVECTRYPFHLYVAVFEELVGMANPEHITSALTMLSTIDTCREDGELLDDNVLVSAYSSVRAPYSEWEAVPMGAHMFRLYQNRKPVLPADRQLLIQLLDRGLTLGWTTEQYEKSQQEIREKGEGEVNLLRMTLSQSKLDIEMVEQLIKAGVSLQPMKSVQSNSKQDFNEYSPLLGAVADCNGKVDRPLMQLLYKINYNLTAGIPLPQALANQNQVRRYFFWETVSFGDSHTTHIFLCYSSILMVSRKHNFMATGDFSTSCAWRGCRPSKRLWSA